MQFPTASRTLFTALTIGGLSLLAASAQTVEQIYLNTFDDAAALTGLTGTGVPEIVEGQLLTNGRVILDLNTLAGYAPRLRNNDAIVAFGFNVSVEDKFVGNEGFQFSLSSNMDPPYFLGAIGYSVNGGSLVGDTTVLSYSNNSGSRQSFISEPNGVPDLPSRGSVKITYNPFSDLWKLYIRVDTVYHDPFSLGEEYKRGEAQQSDHTSESLRYLIFGDSSAISMDNVSVSLIDTGFTLDPPAQITITGAENPEDIDLSWAASFGADSYRVFRNTTDEIGTATLIAEPMDESYSDSTAEAGVTYYYWVKSVRHTDESDTATGGSGIRGLLPVPGLTATQNSFSKKIEVRWGAVPGASQYRVYRGETGVFDDATELVTTSEFEYTDERVVNHVDYFYWVVPRSAVTEGSPASVVRGRGADYQPDLWIGVRGGPVRGIGIAGIGGTSQKVVGSEKNRRPIVSTVWVDSLGARSDVVLLRGTKGNRKLAVKYLGGGNVTGQIVTGRLSMAAGSATNTIKIKVSPGRDYRKRGGKLKLNLTIRGLSTIQPEFGDVVQLKAISLPKSRR